MGSEQILKTRGRFVRPDLITWSAFDDQDDSIELTAEEIERVQFAFPKSKIAIGVATEIKRLKAFSTSHRELAKINRGEKGWSLRNINKLYKCLSPPPPIEKNNPSPNTNISGANAPLTIDF